MIDSNNHRALIWNSFPTGNSAPADVVIGQMDFDLNHPNDDDGNRVPDLTASRRTLRNPASGVHSNGVQLAITDNNNHRVLIWNQFPSANFQPADRVLGQWNFVNRNANAGDEARSQTLSQPTGVTFTPSGLAVTDTSNYRVLIFDSR